MQEFVREGHFFWDFTGRKWGFSGFPGFSALRDRFLGGTGNTINGESTISHYLGVYNTTDKWAF